MTERYIYNVGYGTIEESSYVQWVKEGPVLTREQLREVVKDCMLEAIRNPSEDDFIPEDPKFQYIIDSDAFDEAMKSRGFEPLQFAAQFAIFGWARATVPGDWNLAGEDKELQEWLKEFAEDD